MNLLVGRYRTNPQSSSRQDICVLEVYSLTDIVIKKNSDFCTMHLKFFFLSFFYFFIFPYFTLISDEEPYHGCTDIKPLLLLLLLKLQLTFLFTAVRLVGGGNVTSQGRVEVFHRGTWGRVCFDYWDSRDANVVCRQLGFEGALSAISRAAFGKGKGIVWMDNVNCAGNESLLTECEHNQGPSVYCSRYEFAGVVCTAGRKTFFTVFG